MTKGKFVMIIIYFIRIVYKNAALDIFCLTNASEHHEIKDIYFVLFDDTWVIQTR